MEIQLIDKILLDGLHEKAASNERLRMNFDLRTTPEDGSQRMLNCLEVGTKVPIHRHEKTAETTICLEGRLDVVFFEQTPDGEFVESSRVQLNPKAGTYGVQIPLGAWHTVEVKEASVIFEAKDGAYGK